MLKRVSAVGRQACDAFLVVASVSLIPVAVAQARWTVPPVPIHATIDTSAAAEPFGNRSTATWEPDRWLWLGGVALAAVEAVLITGLLVQRRRRAHAQEAAAQRVRFEQLVSEVSATLAVLSPTEVEAQLPQILLRVATALGFDHASLVEFPSDPTHAAAPRSLAVAGDPLRPGPLALERLPWTLAAVQRGELVRWPAARDIPTAASEDRKAFATLGMEGFVCIPLRMGRAVIGALSLATIRQTAPWSERLIHGSELVGQMFAHVIVRRHAENAVGESEEWFRMMADSAPVMIWMAAEDDGRTYCNREWLAFTGRRLGEELGPGWADGVHADDREQCLERYRKHFRAREEFRLEYRLRRHDGEYRWLLDHGVPRLSHDGAFRGYVGACSDISEIRIAHDTMLETLSLRSAIFGSLYGHVAALDRRGVIVAVNEAWSKFHKDDGWGMMRPALGTDYVAACQRAAAAGAAGAPQAEKALRTVLEGRASRASCEYVAHSGADERWFEMTVEPFNRPERGIIVTHIDITRRRRAEAEARREREELAHVLRVTTLSEMAASLAHEISQPLAAIVSNAQAARLMLAKQTVRDEEVDGALTDIGDDAKRAGHIIRRLRALFRKEWTEQRKPVNVNDIIMEVMALLQAELKPKGVTVQLLPGRRLPAVYGDAIQLQQVILNVIVNAAEAMVGAAIEHGVVTVVTVHNDAGTVDITIGDSGPGVGEHDLDRIFEPFVTTKKAGLGMGLAISQSIIQAHGGRIWATRNVDRGLTIHIELPSEEPEDQP